MPRITAMPAELEHPGALHMMILGLKVFPFSTPELTARSFEMVHLLSINHIL